MKQKNHINAEVIRKFFNVLITDSGGVVELRVLNVKPKSSSGKAYTLSGYFGSAEAMVQELEKAPESASGYYVTLNPFDPSLVERSPNQLGFGKGAVKDSDILCRRFLPIDFDPTRPAGVSATEEEREKARTCMETVRAFLEESGFPEPVIGDSGNGAHLLYPIDLPTDDKGACKRTLQLLDQMFSSEAVKVDTCVYNPSRIWKLYGTMARKGESTADRPHRMAQLTSIPPVLEPMTMMRLEAFLEAHAPKPSEPTPKVKREAHRNPCDASLAGDRTEVSAFLERNYLEARGPEPYEDGHRWVLKTCPWREGDGETAFIIQFASGAISAGCQHETCPGSRSTGNHWNDLRQLFEPNADSKFLQTEYGLADLFVAQHWERCRYVEPWGTWLHFNGRHWAKGSNRIEGLAQDTIRGLSKGPAGKKSKLAEWATGCQKASTTKNIIRLAQSREALQCDVDAFDADPWLFNCTNGTIDLRTLAFRSHQPSDLIMQISNCAYDADAKAAIWNDTLQAIFQDDPELIDYIQKVAGYCLTGETKEQVYFLFCGAGANGKSTLVETLMALFGDYGKPIPSDLLTKQPMEGHPTKLADLHRARLVVASELKSGDEWDEQRVKSLTDGGKISARRMREDFWSFTPTHKLVICTNHPPITQDHSEGFWRRLRLIPFNRTFERHERDLDLGHKLKAEHSGILNWALEGCRKWQREGLQPPQAVLDATHAYRMQEDALGRFLSERCEIVANACAGAQELRNAYNTWAKANEESTVTAKTFSRKMQEKGYTPRKCSVMKYDGLRLKRG